METWDFVLRTIVIVGGFVLILAGYIPSAIRDDYKPGVPHVALFIMGALCIAAGASY